MRLLEVEKLSHSQSGMAAAHRAGLPLMDAGWMRFPAPCWDQPAILAFESETCVAGLNWSENRDTLILSVDFAWCDPSAPSALSALLLRFRRRYRDGPFTAVHFTCHAGNEAMAKAVKVLRLTPHSQSYRMHMTTEAKGA